MEPKRYDISPAAKRIDRAMTHVIKVGGVGIIVSVFAIFIFILSQIFPLFNRARVEAVGAWEVPPGDYVALGTDEWTERPCLLDRSGRVWVFDLVRGGAPLGMRAE